MVRAVNRLSARQVQTLTKPGRHADGDGLYLSISADGLRRRWVFLFRDKRTGKLREKGLGTPVSVTLKDAREAAAKARHVLKEGRDPLERAPETKSAPTFGNQVAELLKSIGGSFRNSKHRKQWETTLTTHASSLSELPIDTISTQDVLGVLAPIWEKTPETAQRLRGRIERVLDSARVKNLRIGENPARWKGHLDLLLPARGQLSRGHHKALAFNQMPNFIGRLRDNGSISALCLEFTILTAARTGESRGAKWSEFDLENNLWTVPAERMKAGKAHRVPLSNRAKAIITQLQDVKISEFVFPGQENFHRSTRITRGTPKTKELSNNAMLMLLRRMNVDCTVHGFRSTFRDWVAESTVVDSDVAEAALAHVLNDKTKAAYRRTDFFDKRRKLMNDWADHCNGAGSDAAKPASPSDFA
ncbi:tyrosine-type recombinase/integrase [Shinella sp. CPCC 101442]|uniref:tyrosine-type recombinase/integrase n=1 Tax=Shinella sp. CPCC 101442 TaxID=2932265 RepID=UPI0021524C92|nr:site-specific integrase [Shinella sp. CPCC 101442]MCR6501538.1 tyrosine-type recombinase/integrase [Shinella sp. CPCC 101442]